jgi:hypothetical protein
VPPGGPRFPPANQRNSRDDVELNEEDFDDIPF